MKEIINLHAHAAAKTVESHSDTHVSDSLLRYGLGWTYKCDIGKIAIVAVGINHCN